MRQHPLSDSRLQSSHLTSTLLSLLLAAAAGCGGDSQAPSLDEIAEPAGAAAAPAAALTFRRVASYDSHTCGVTTDDLAYCWGYNFAGQLGDGTTTERPAPAAVSGGLRFRAVSPGISHTCGLTTDDQAYCWGENAEGQLGDGSTTSSTTPVAVASKRRFRQLSAGAGHTCGVTFTDRALCWGSNASGALGDGTRSSRTRPGRVKGPDLLFAEVSAGEDYTCAVDMDGGAHCWGTNNDGQLGDGTQDTERLTPVPVVGEHRFLQVSAEFLHTCGVTVENIAYCWGRNSVGQLGDGSDNPRRLKPSAVAGGLRFQRVGLGYNHTCGVTTDALAYCWGSNGSGQLGDGTRDFANTPVAVAGRLRFADVDAAGGHSCGVSLDDRGYCWGDNFFGQLGDGNSGVGAERLTPVPVAGPS